MRSPIKILIVGFGDVGKRVAKRLRDRYAVSALVRSADHARTARGMGVVPIRGDLRRPRSLQKIAGVADVVFHFAPPPGHGRHDTHTRHLLAALTRPLRGRPARPETQLPRAWRSCRQPRRLVYVSTTGVYGDCGGEWIDETRALMPTTARARRRVDAERCLIAWGRRSGVMVSILRAPGIYANDRLPIDRLRRGTPALMAKDDVFTNHIHADDLARVAIAAMKRGRAGRVYNAVDDSALSMADYFDRVADAFDLPRPPRVSRVEAAKILSPALMSFMSESRRIGNARLKRELRCRLQYPTVDDFLQKISPRSR